jgi:hypothetical protein
VKASSVELEAFSFAVLIAKVDERNLNVLAS